MICFFLGHKVGLTYRNNQKCFNMDKQTIQIWVECKRCLKTLTKLEFSNKKGYISQVWET